MGLEPMATPWLTAQRARLSLDDGQVVAPVVDRPGRQVMRALDHPRVLADDLPLGRDDEPVGVDPQADRAVGERRRDTVAVPLEADQAGRRHPLALLDEAVKGRRRLHQGRLLPGPDLRDGPRQRAMRRAPPQLDAALLEPSVQCRQVGEVRHQLQDQVTRILHVLLDLSFLPPRGRIAELGLEDIVAGHRQEPGVDLTRLAGADPVDRGLRSPLSLGPMARQGSLS
jgi:hypothetical protein